MGPVARDTISGVPHTTATFGFEFKIFGWAQALAQSLGRREDAGFVLVFDNDGTVRLTMVPVKLDAWQKIREQVALAESYILYDPFDIPEYAFLEWKGVARDRMESVVGQTFDEDDLRGLQDDGFPLTWQVMF